jgi:hypothetical protein
MRPQLGRGTIIVLHSFVKCILIILDGGFLQKVYPVRVYDIGRCKMITYRRSQRIFINEIT